MRKEKPTRVPPRDDLLAEADRPAPGLLAEFWEFLRREKKWWLLPIVIAILLLGGLVVLSSSPLGPMIYPLF